MEEPREPGPASAAEAEDPMHASESDETQGLTMVGAKTVELYQKQVEISERVWSYMSLYSGIVFILSLVLLLAPEDWLELPDDKWYWIFPALAYLAFAVGTHTTLRHALAELRLMRGIAISHSGLELRGFKAATAERFHLALVAFVLGFFVLAIFKAYQQSGS